MIVDPSGLIVTNYHVINGMTQVKVALADRREFEAEIVLRDPRTDLAVLRIKGGDHFPFMEMGDSDALEVGDFVIAIGDPFGVGQTVTQGIVSALARTQIGASDYGFFIQTDAAINPGNSGGALVDLDGRLVGVNSMIYSRSGGSMGLGFAIPVNMVKGVVSAALHGGQTVKRPWLGATLQNVSKDIADNLGLARPTGALVVDVTAQSPAAAAGLRRGDVIAAIDGQTVDDSESVGFRLGVKPLGGAASLKVLRDGRTLDLSLKLASAPEIPPRDTLTIHGSSPFAGAEVMNLSPAVKEELSLQGANDGVVVAAVGDGSTAAAVGVQKGRRRGRRQRPQDRDHARTREGLRGARAMVGSDNPARRADHPDPARRLGRAGAQSHFRCAHIHCSGASRMKASYWRWSVRVAARASAALSFVRGIEMGAMRMLKRAPGRRNAAPA